MALFDLDATRNLLGRNSSEETEGFIGGAITGGLAGSASGPVGAAIGITLGGFLGLHQAQRSRQIREQELRDIETARIGAVYRDLAILQQTEQALPRTQSKNLRKINVNNSGSVGPNNDALSEAGFVGSTLGSAQGGGSGTSGTF